MIVIDTSAIMAVVLNEPECLACDRVIETHERILISAATLSEVLIVAGLRGVAPDVKALVDRLSFEVIPVTQETALRVAHAHARWGKGRHPAALNFGDCFAYDLAKLHDCPLLFIGNDFSKTDLSPAM